MTNFFEFHIFDSIQTIFLVHLDVLISSVPDTVGSLVWQSAEAKDHEFFGAKFISNFANGSRGGGGAISLNGTGINCAMEDMTFTKNSALRTGGAVLIVDASEVSITKGSFIANRAPQGGGLWAVVCLGFAKLP